MRIVGIDNGLDGSLAAVDGKKVDPRVMPVFGKEKREYDVPRIIKLLTQCKPDHVFLENAQAMPGQGVSSMFSIGKGFGIMLGVLATLKIPYTIVSPRSWQKVIFKGIRKKDTKAASYTFCSRRWPEATWTATERSRKPHDGMTDAACIAEYGRLQLMNAKEYQKEAFGGDTDW